MFKKYFSKLDYGIIVSVIFLIFIGLLALYSASHGAFSDAKEFTKQISWVVAGTVSFILLSLIDYKFFKSLSLPFYVIMIVLLILVLFSPQNNGATSWFKVGAMSFQPAEFVKIAIILLIARIIEIFETKENLNKFLHIVMIGALIVIPTILIVLQPDYGTAMVIIFFSSIMLFMAGINVRYIVIGLVLAFALVPILYFTILPEHAKARIDTFFDPSKDPNGAGYNVIQSEIAVGAGEVTGMGLFSGNQTQLGTIPMKTTDFIFSTIAEEMGFLGAMLVLLLYTIVFIRLIHISRISKDIFGKMVCIGTFSMLLFHVVQNIGMCIGILPITGIPLPLLSYGGSSMLTNMILLGICESISVHRKAHLFF